MKCPESGCPHVSALDFIPMPIAAAAEVGAVRAFPSFLRFLSWVFGDAAAARGAGFFDDFARAATRNPDSSTVVLGKFAEGGVSYVKVAAHFKASYFKVVDWANATRGLSQGEIWKINEAFLRQQIQAGKQVILSHNPATATGFFAKEVGYLEALGYRFVQEGWFWRAVR
jgi:hypothetical protein